MACVVAKPCIGVKDKCLPSGLHSFLTDGADFSSAQQLYINPNECIRSPCDSEELEHILMSPIRTGRKNPKLSARKMPRQDRRAVLDVFLCDLSHLNFASRAAQRFSTKAASPHPILTDPTIKPDQVLLSIGRRERLSSGRN